MPVAPCSCACLPASMSTKAPTSLAASKAAAAAAGVATRASKKRSALGDISNQPAAVKAAKARRSEAIATASAAAQQAEPAVIELDSSPESVYEPEAAPVAPAVVDIYATADAQAYRELATDFFSYRRELEVQSLCLCGCVCCACGPWPVFRTCRSACWRVATVDAAFPCDFSPSAAQSATAVPANYMQLKQTDVTPAMRAILVDWLVEVAEEYKLHAETLFTCVRHLRAPCASVVLPACSFVWCLLCRRRLSTAPFVNSTFPVPTCSCWDVPACCLPRECHLTSRGCVPRHLVIWLPCARAASTRRYTRPALTSSCTFQTTPTPASRYDCLAACFRRVGPRSPLFPSLIPMRPPSFAALRCALLLSWLPPLNCGPLILGDCRCAPQMLAMESTVLSHMSFRLATATAKQFLHRFVKAAELTDEQSTFVAFLAELTLQEYDFLAYKPSVIAAACVLYARIALCLPVIWVRPPAPPVPLLCRCCGVAAHACYPADARTGALHELHAI